MKILFFITCGFLLFFHADAQVKATIVRGSAPNSVKIIIKPNALISQNLTIKDITFSVAISRPIPLIVPPQVRAEFSSSSILFGKYTASIETSNCPYETHTIHLTGEVVVNNLVPRLEYELVELFFSGNSEVFEPVLYTGTNQSCATHDIKDYHFTFNTDLFTQDNIGDAGPFYPNVAVSVNNTSSNTIGYSHIIIPANSTTLPLAMTDVNANVLSDCSVSVNWSVSDEHANDTYDIEKSTDGKTFSVVKTITAQGGKNGENKYSVKLPAEPEFSFIRIKAADIYSNIMSVNTGKCRLSNSSSEQIKVVPSVISGGNSVTLFYNSSRNEIAIVKVWSMLGALVSASTVNFHSGKNEMSLSSAKVPAGMYIVQVTSDGEMQASAHLVVR